MEIALSRKGNYAVRAVLDLAVHYGHGLRKAREIAEEMRIPRNFLSLILSDLVRAGVLRATAGPAGGYELVVPPSEVSLLEIVELAEGPIELTRCVLRGAPCGAAGYCAAHDIWTSAQDALVRHLASTTFADIATANEALRGTRAAAGTVVEPRTRRGQS